VGAGATPSRPPRVPHSSFTTWEPAAEKDDDQPIFVEGAAQIPEPPPLPGTTESPVPREQAAEPVGEGRAHAPSNENEVAHGIQLFVNVGRRDGARASDLQGMLEAAGLSKDEIGPIRVRDRNSFVSVRREAAERGIAAFTGKTVGSRGLIAEIARPRSGDA